MELRARNAGKEFLTTRGRKFPHGVWCLMLAFVVLVSNPAFSDEPVLPETPGAEQKSIRILSPEGGEVWEEGETCIIRWESEGVEEVHVAVAVGGKDKGLLEDDGGRVAIDATKGFFEWAIPEGFITAFGPEKSENVRVMVFDTEDFETRDASDYFTVTGKRSAPSGSNPGGESDSPWVDTIEKYYEAIGEGRYREAYEMLCDCKVVVTDPDGSKVSLGPRPDFATWQQAHHEIKKAEVLHVEEVSEENSSLSGLGFRMFRVTVDLRLREKSWSVPSGESTFFIHLVKGAHGIVRILGIGTGP